MTPKYKRKEVTIMQEVIREYLSRQRSVANRPTRTWPYTRLCDKENRRILFFCACEFPKGCHRYEVGKLLIKVAKKRGINLEVVEWPGGEPQEVRENVAEDTLKRIQKGAQMLPLPAEPDLVKYAGLPWGSTAGLKCGSQQLFFMTGPAKYARGGWGLPVYTYELFEDRKEPKEIATEFRLVEGFDPRFSMK